MGKFSDSNSNKYCSVPQCKSRCTNEISLFRFPRDIPLRKRWSDAIKIEKEVTEHMQVCSRHFVKNDYILSEYPGAAKVRRLRKTAVPSQNLPWQFPNKRVSPTLAKARMERLMNRSQQKTSDSPVSKTEPSSAKKSEPVKLGEPKSPTKSDTNESDDITSVENISVDLKIEKDDEIEDKKEEAVEASVVKSTAKSDDAPEAKKNANNMRETAPTRLRNRKGVLKCEFCGRKCLTPRALQTHQQTAHKNARTNLINLKKDSPTINNPKSSPKPVPVALISVKSPKKLPVKPVEKPIVKDNKLAKSMNASELVEKVLQEDSDLGTISDSSDSSVKKDSVKIEKLNQTKTEFECPKCKRRFAVYFMASRHIQKHHSGGPNGSKMSSNLIPKPNRIEICTICSSTLDGNIHLCAGPLKLALGFICTGCEQDYKTLTLFDMHKSSMHSEGVESMFFSTLDEFETWKQKMETQTKVKYSILDQNDTKKIHRCTHRTVLGTGSQSRQRMCPSSVVVQEFTKGFQVHYYPNHYGHKFQPYSLSEAFKKYSITSLMSLTANRLPDSDEEVQIETDLYIQFKKLTDIVVNEAAKINVNGLKQLMRKALEMIAILKNYDEDDDISTSKSVIRLDQQDNLQEEVKKALLSLKRKPSEQIEESPAKRSKSVFQSTENTLKSTQADSIKLSSTISLSNMKDDEIENVKCQKRKPSEPQKLNQSPQKLNQSLPKVNQSPSFLGTFEDFVGKTFVKSTEKKKKQNSVKKNIVKTKIGQFKQSPNKNPKTFSPSPKKSPVSPRTSIGSVKEIKYEVKEQENDCNILILKI